MFQGNLFLPTEGIQKKVLGVLADSCRHMVVYALEKKVVRHICHLCYMVVYALKKRNIILFTLKDDCRCQSCKNVKRDCVYIER